MDGWLKFLIAAACVVVIGGGGYYAWNEWAASAEANAKAQKIAEEKIQNAQREQDPKFIECRASLTNGELGDAKRLRDWCRQNNYITYNEQLKAEGVVK